MTAMSRDYGDVGDPLNPCHLEHRPQERSDQEQVEGRISVVHAASGSSYETIHGLKNLSDYRLHPLGL